MIPLFHDALISYDHKKCFCDGSYGGERRRDLMSCFILTRSAELMLIHQAPPAVDRMPSSLPVLHDAMTVAWVHSSIFATSRVLKRPSPLGPLLPRRYFSGQSCGILF